MAQARLIDDPAQSGSWNMSVDQALLRSAIDSGQITLRFYRWTPPTLSLGYFQASQRRQEHLPSLDCDLVRRTTGGGAILHDRELTYSLCVPGQSRWAVRPIELYQLVHRAIIDALMEWKIGANLYESTVASSSQEAFLCFERRSIGDIVLNGSKICGSAQRRGHGAILQHGSILLSQSDYAPELPGVRQLSGIEVDESELSNVLIRCLEHSFQLTFLPANLNNREQLDSQEIQQKQFGQHDWNFGR